MVAIVSNVFKLMGEFIPDPSVVGSLWESIKGTNNKALAKMLFLCVYKV